MAAALGSKAAAHAAHKDELRLGHLRLYRGGFMHGGGGTATAPGFVFDPGYLTLKTTGRGRSSASEIHFIGPHGHWQIAQDVANHGGGGRDFVAAARLTPRKGGGHDCEDIIYLTPSPNGTRVGIGRAPPTGGYRLETGGQGSDGGLGIKMGENATGNPLGIYDSAGDLRMRVTPYPHFGLELTSKDGTTVDVGDEIAALKQRVAALEGSRPARDGRKAKRETRLVRTRRTLRSFRRARAASS